MENNKSHANTTPDIIDADYPAESLSPELARQRQAMIDKINFYGKRVERYSDDKVKHIWTDIFVNDLSDAEVAQKHGCSMKYSWNVRHNRVRKTLLKKFRQEYFNSRRESNEVNQMDIEGELASILEPDQSF